MAKLYGLIVFVTTIFICLLAPERYDHEYSVFCGVLYWMQVVVYMLIRNKKNYFDFDSIFFITYFFVTLYYSVVMYETDPYRYVFYQLYFKKNTLPLASGLAVLGISGYIFGSLLLKDKEISTLKLDYADNFKPIRTTWMFIAAFILVVLYVVVGGYEMLINEYIGGGGLQANDSGFGSYFFAFFPAFLISGIISEFFNMTVKSPEHFRLKHLNKVGVAVTAMVFLMFFLVGSRTIPLQILLLCVGLHAVLYYPIKLQRFVIYILAGFVVLAAVGILRNQLAEKKEIHMDDAALDLIANNRNTFVVIDYVNKNGFTYGESMLSPVLAPLPFAQSAVISTFDLDQDKMRSALITTKESLGEVGSWGLGTNIVADVYLAFGLLGIIILFPLLGFLVHFSQNNFYNSVTSLTLYSVLISYAIYLARAEYFYFFRYFIWCYLILFFSLRRKKIKR
ncbi:O-antigen polysaccharide polymerase Wzy [Kaistella daneshvariae]|uniref:Oligosaccharide repeat unit polymerase n=2 Tax=Kaistella TaxID=2782231 RepID=A0A1I3NLC6_9FLAO|nr:MULTISPECIES: O-antigen polysaccharide polymerase Wzy [Kaistella]AZI66583.1 O-antigen polysaccharide polymerase Wzy [Kaistella daneshvariae]SFJ09760.1 oligosaccharide repeat unit polymerase [Kaistella treverensis]